MAAEKKLFGTTEDGTEVYLYSLKNKNGMEAQVISYGAVLVRLFVPDRNGNTADVVLGYDELEGYYENAPGFGATIGPNANRIADASFTLDGITHHLDANNGPNNLHSHAQLGYHKRVWKAAESENESSILFSLKDQDGCMGFPGNKEISVCYTLTDENELKIHYHGESDQNTILNMTNHTYFNLAGHGAGEIGDHILTIHAGQYTPVREGAIPTGEIAEVTDTPMDFRRPVRVGDRIDDDFEQLNLTRGYDHNWIPDGAAGEMRQIAVVEEHTSGRRLLVSSDLPGVQFYAGNFIENEKGKDGVIYQRRDGLCLETQYYPNTANEPRFPSAVFGPDRIYDTETIFRFVW